MKWPSLRNRGYFGLLVFLLAVGLADRPASAADGLTLLYDYIRDSNDRSFHDKSIRVDYRQVYGTALLGNWQTGGEIGGHLLDQRRSSYSGLVRFRHTRGLLDLGEGDRTYQLGTEQVLAKGYVAKLLGRYIQVSEPEPPEDKERLFVYGIGFDKYYGDYNYFSAMYFNDPREAGRFSVVLSHTLADRDSYFRVGIVPRSDHKTGHFIAGKYHWILLAYSFERHFDFTTFDRRVVTLGLQIPFDRKWSHKE